MRDTLWQKLASICRQSVRVTSYGHVRWPPDVHACLDVYGDAVIPRVMQLDALGRRERARRYEQLRELAALLERNNAAKAPIITATQKFATGEHGGH